MTKPSQIGTDRKLTWRSFGPGILMASAAIGASHLVSSTQAGALYGWQLAIIIILANFFKYPFYRFATEYAYNTGESLVVGYARKSRLYLWIFFVMSIISSVITTGAVALLCAVILGHILPFELDTLVLSAIVMVSSWVLLIGGRYKMLDSLTKWIIAALTIATVAAVAIAAGKPPVMTPDFIELSPWNLAALGFVVALMGFMPAPLEFSVITSVWTAEKIRTDHTSRYQGMVDFNVGYMVSTVLALFFLALGVFVQYGSGQEIAMQGGAYVGQLVDMYATTIGDWTKPLVTFIAFLCMFGTVITSADGYGRITAESLSLIVKDSSELTEKYLKLWTTFALASGYAIIAFFLGQMAALLKFAMISAFVAAPIYAYLNYSLIKNEPTTSSGMRWFAISGIVFLTGFSALFLLQFFGVVG